MIGTFKNLPNFIRMTVSDNGNGIDKQISDPQSVFEKGVTTTNGSGLGLFNVSSFVEDQLHGIIELDKDAITAESKFIINITFPK